MTPAEFIREIAGPSRRPLYVVGGGEPSAAAKCLAAAAGAAAEDFRDFNFQLLDLEPGQAGQLLAAAATRPFGPPPRIVAAKNPPFEAEDWNALAGYLDDPNPETVVILVLDKPDARLRFMKKVQAAGLEVDCRPPKGAGLIKWLAEEFKSRGLSAAPEALRLMVERIGEDPGPLAAEAEKLSLYLAGERSLSAELARELVVPVLDAQIYNLTNHLSRRQFRAVLTDILEIMSDDNREKDKKTRTDSDGKARMILGALETRLLALTYFKTPAPPGGAAVPEFAAHLSSHARTLVQEQAPRWPLAELTRALSDLEEIHRSLFTGEAHPQAALENFILKLSPHVRP